MYAHVLHYTKIKSKRKYKIRNIKLSKIFLPTVYMYYNLIVVKDTCIHMYT